jgi:hypothetical protein
LENRESDPLVDNFILDALNEILECEDLDKALNDCEQKPACLFSAHITDQQPPSFETLIKDKIQIEEPQLRNQNTEKFESELKLVTGIPDGEVGDNELFRKRMFLDPSFVGMLEYMMEDTLFNLMEEATYEEFDLTQAPKIYIRKDKK